MNNIYHKYYLSEDEIIEIIANGLIVFDTSALLALYGYSSETQTEFFQNVFPILKNRLWIPSQVYFEYLKNKDTVARKTVEQYKMLLSSGNKKEDGGYIDKISSISKDIGKDELEALEGQLQTFREKVTDSKKHPYIENADFSKIDKGIDNVKKSILRFQHDIEVFKEEFERAIKNKIDIESNITSDVQQSIEMNFTIGEELTYDRMMKIAKEGSYRYSEKIPPGYMDAKDKIGLQKYGDLFVWKEIIHEATSKKHDVILVTNDVKEDWWDKEQNAPRLELLKEMCNATGKKFWTCRISQFLHLFKLTQEMKSESMDDAIDEAVLAEEELLQQEEHEESERLYLELLDKWMNIETDIRNLVRLKDNSEWRVFGKHQVFSGNNFSGEKYIVMLNVIDKVLYSNVLHAFKNLREIINYYESFGYQYRGYQVIAVRNKQKGNEVMKIKSEKSKLDKLFRNTKIENTLVYINEGEFVYLDANHAMG